MPDVPSRVSSPQFVGRLAELERLDASFAAVSVGAGGRAVLIGGEAGIGKTRLVAEVAERARAADGIVLSGACFELAGPAGPFGPIVQSIRGLRRSLDPATWNAVVGSADPVVARLVADPDPEAPGSSGGTAAMFELLLGMFERLGDRMPVLLALEDLHWSDHTTRDFIVFLARNLREARVMLVGTFRTDDLHRRHPLRNVLVELDRAGAAERFDLARFDRDELRTLILGIIGTEPSDEVVESTFARSDGNAFFAEELLACGEGAPLSESLRDIVLTRVDALPDAARKALRTIAVIGPRADDRLVAALAGMSEPELLRGLRDAVEHQVLVTDGSGTAYAFRHALVREVVYDDLLPGERVRLHAAVAEHLAEHPECCDGGPAMLAGEIAEHWYAAHDPRRALVAALAAAREAERLYAYSEALGQIERALELWPRVVDPETAAGVSHLDVVHDAAVKSHLCGDIERALSFIVSAIEDAEPDDDPTTVGLLHERWARCLRELGAPPEEILAHAEAAVALVDEASSVARARVQATLGQQLMLSGRCAAAVGPCEDAIALGERAGALAIVSHARNSLALSLANLGDHEAGLAGLVVARQEAVEARAWDDVARADTNHASLLSSDARHAEALAVLLEAEAMASSHGLGSGSGRCVREAICEALWMLGRWSEIERWLDDIDRTRTSGVDEWQVAQLRVELSAGRGDFDAARVHRERLRKLLGTNFDVRWQLVLTHLDVQVALWEGELTTALDAAQRFASWRYEGTVCPDTHPSAALMLNAMSAASMQAARAREQTGSHARLEHARRVASEFAMTFDDWSAGSRWGLGRPGDLIPVGQQIEAELALVEGRGEAETWSMLAAEWVRREMPPRASYAMWREAELRVVNGDRLGASDPARAAYALAETIGWQWVRDGVGDLARRARIDIAGNTQAAPDSVTRAGLTPREADVLRLVAAGRTNRQIGETLFISTKTASAHVSNLLAKLGVANRAEAGAAARRLDLD
jgi:ATP/maltotriose-dependent transcriptional regulator MalT